MKKAGNLIISGVMLSLVSLFLRTVSVYFGAYINGKTGAVGTGLFSLVMSVYSPVLTLVTAGTNLAVSRIGAESLGSNDCLGMRSVIRNIIIYCLTVSCTVSAVLFLLSDSICASWLGDVTASNYLKTLSLALPFAALSSAMSGYFISVRKVSRNAAVNVGEALVRMAFTVYMLTRYGDSEVKCLGIVVVCSCLCDILSCLILYLLCRIDLYKMCGRGQAKSHGVMGRILEITLPVSVSSFLRSGLVALQHILIPRGLRKSGASFESAMSEYGALSGMAMPIIMFPASFLYSFTGILIPELAEDNAKNDSKNVKKTSYAFIYYVLVFSVCASVILLSFSEALGKAIYGSDRVGHFIMIMAPLIPVMYLDTSVDTVLKGIGEQIYTMKVNIADALISVICVWFLVPIFKIYGYIIVIFVSELFNFIASYLRLRRVLELKMSFFRLSVKPLLSVGISVLLSRLILSPLQMPFMLYAVLGIGLSTALCILTLLITGAVPNFFNKTKRQKSGYNTEEACHNITDEII